MGSTKSQDETAPTQKFPDGQVPFMTWGRHDLSQTIEQLPIGVAVTLPIGTVEYANPHLHRLLEQGTENITGNSLADFRAAGSSSRDEHIRRRIFSGRHWQGETQLRTATGQVRHMLESVFPLKDDNGRITHFMHFLQDIGELEAAETLSNLAYYDSLTGLPNRNLFNDRLSRAMAGARRSRGGFALLYVDIDHFKQINDTLGHDAGDELLRQLAVRLQKCLRRIDTVARLGGDEFVIILEQVTDTAVAMQIVEKLMAVCSGDYELRGAHRKVTLSVGISRYPRDAMDPDSLMQFADKAMYKVKAGGRNGYQLREPAPAEPGDPPREKPGHRVF
jgi:diguanylate cyclase (GGDEF)-like protein/PAS domain S-box-containing protein